MGKYDPLRRFLENVAPDVSEITLSFAQIEQILDDTLPNSARRHQAWWANEQDGRHVQAASWLGTGWAVDTVDQERKWIRFQLLP